MRPCPRDVVHVPQEAPDVLVNEIISACGTIITKFGYTKQLSSL